MPLRGWLYLRNNSDSLAILLRILRASSLLSNLAVVLSGTCFAAGEGLQTMTTNNRSQLIGLSVLILTATITMALAQNTSNPLRSGNTTNPILSGNTVIQPPPVPVSPALSTTILTPPIGRNSFTGLPCSAGSVPVTQSAGAPSAAGQPPSSGTTTTQPLQSVFGSAPAC